MIKRVNQITSILKKASPDLLLAGGTVSIIAAGVTAIRQTPKAIRILEDEEIQDNPRAQARKLVPLYLPSVGLTIVGVGSIVLSRNITKNRMAAVTTAYAVSETMYRTYKNKVRDLVEPEKYEEIKKEVGRDILKNDSIKDKEIYVTKNNDVLMYDSISGRYFTGNVDDIEGVVNKLNKRMMTEMYTQLNEFYSEIGLSPIKIGTDLGWHIDKELINVDFSSSITDDNRPCIVLDYDLVMV